MGTKTVKYNKQGIDELPNDKPVFIGLRLRQEYPNYIGVAQRGRVQERILEHLETIPGAKVRIEQFNSITDAQKKEVNVIRRAQAKYNKQVK